MKIDLEKLKEVENKYENSIVCTNALQQMVDRLLISGKPDILCKDTSLLMSYETLLELGIIKD